MHALLAILVGEPAATRPIVPSGQVSVLTPAQLFDVADLLKRAKRFAEAEAAYEALSTNPDVAIRSEARFRLAMMLSSLGRHSKAALWLRRILDEQPEAQRARIELAGILAKIGRISDAQRELRAVQATGLPPEAARLVSRFSASLRARAPYGASVGFALAPDTNINRGTQLDSLGTVFGDFAIGKDAKRHSGVGFTADGEAFVRKPITGRINLLAKLVSSARLYRRSAFNDIAVAPSIGPEFAIGADRLNLSATRSWRWFGRSLYSNSVGVESSYEHPLRTRALLRSAFAVHRVDNHRNDLEDGTQVFASAAGEIAVSTSSGIGMGSAVVRRKLRDAGYSNWGAYQTLYGWREAGRVTLSASLTGGRLWADGRLLIYPRKRVDTYWRASFGGVLRQASLGGFAPSVQLVVERNRSTVAIYDFRRRAVEIGISRAF